MLERVDARSTRSSAFVEGSVEGGRRRLKTSRPRRRPARPVAIDDIQAASTSSAGRSSPVTSRYPHPVTPGAGRHLRAHVRSTGRRVRAHQAPARRRAARRSPGGPFSAGGPSRCGTMPPVGRRRPRRRPTPASRRAPPPVAHPREATMAATGVTGGHPGPAAGASGAGYAVELRGITRRSPASSPTATSSCGSAGERCTRSSGRTAPASPR